MHAHVIQLLSVPEMMPKMMRAANSATYENAQVAVGAIATHMTLSLGAQCRSRRRTAATQPQDQAYYENEYQGWPSRPHCSSSVCIPLGAAHT